MDKTFDLGAMNHVGVAVPDMDAAIAFYRDVMGVTDITEPAILAPQGVTYAFVNLPTGQVAVSYTHLTLPTKA